MNSEVTIRPYRADDRDAVRRLAYETGEAGSPSTFPDPRLFMDLITRYYTDQEPGSLWIAERAGRVIGYLTGCLDSHRYLHWMKTRGHGITAAHVIFRNTFRPAIWKWACARIKTLREGGAHRPEWIRSYPAHLHVNLSVGHRGSGAGSALIDRFFEQARAAHVPGVHLATRGDNMSAQNFFKHCGFVPIAQVNAYRPVPSGFAPVPVLIMGKLL